MSYSALKENLEKLIKERNCPVTELERKAGVKKNNIYFILRGVSKKPSAELLQSIADALGVTVRDLLTPSSKISTYLDDSDFDLMEQVVKDTIKEIKKFKMNVTETDFANAIIEIFNYSRNSKISDQKFINWITQQKFRKNSI